MQTQSLFGGRVRAATLEALASTSRPLSAYRIAKLTEASPIQVLTILKALEPDVVRHSPSGWVLQSEPLRKFLRDFLERHASERRAEKDELLVRLRLKTSGSQGRT